VCEGLCEATREFRLAVYRVPWVHRRVLAIWHTERQAGRASSRMSDSFGVHAPEDRERLQSCLETLESTWQCGDDVRLAQLLLDADLSHEVLRRLHRELLRLSSGMTGCQDSDALEKELGCAPQVFRQMMRTIAASFDRMTRRKNELVESHLGLVLAQASQFEHLGVPLADLVQEGNAGLLRASERFDPSRGVGFVTYALWWIRHGMIRAVQNHGRTVRLPTHRHEAVREFRKRERELERELGRPPRRGELARALGVEVSQIDELRRVQAPVVSLDAHLPEGDSGAAATWVDVLGDPNAGTAIETLESSDQMGHVLEEIATLPPRERRILMLRYGIGGEARSLREIGQDLCLSGERVRQLEISALDRLRRRFARKPCPA